MDSLADEDLIAQYRLAPGSSRSRPLLEELFRRHYARVVTWCYRFCGDRDRAADLAQDVFGKAYIAALAALDAQRSSQRSADGASGAGFGEVPVLESRAVEECFRRQ